MQARSLSLAQRSFIPLLALGLLDRLYLLFVFGFNYVGDDDGVIWAAAVDYGHGLFREPYFYGQDYAVMLEALVAAPFTHLGIPLHILMPTVTSLLALAPFWSFAFWHRKHDRPFAAVIFLAMPVLLPVEYGLMTAITRCFISGIAPLAFLPWVLDLKNDRLRASLIGLVASAAAFINPNSLVFSVAFCAWFALYRPGSARAIAWILAGTIPFVLAFHFAQAYCKEHPERMMHTVNDWRMVFHPELVPESFGMLNSHFAWLFPVFPSMGGLAFLTLVALVLWHMRSRNWPMAVALACALGLIVLSFAFAKTHDGTWSFLYPYGRMYLALPLAICWCLAATPPGPVPRTALVVTALIGCATMVGIKYNRTADVVATHLAWPDLPVVERPIATLDPDLRRLRRLCDTTGVQLIVGTNALRDPIPARLRCFLYPVLDPDLPPTYLYGMERRFWQRDLVADSVFDRVLVLGADNGDWTERMRQDPRWTDLSTTEAGTMHVIHGNTLSTDSLMAQVEGMGQNP